MQQRKKHHTGRLVVLVLILVLAVTVIVAKVLTADTRQNSEALRQELSAAIKANESLKPIVSDAQTYQDQLDAVSRITSNHADPSTISSGLTSSAMENAAREEGYVSSRDIVFKDPKKQ